MADRRDDAGDEKGEGHAQEQRVKFAAFGEKCGEDAVERGHDEGSGWDYWVGKTVGASSNWNFAV
jgi:hypothetical protein